MSRDYTYVYREFDKYVRVLEAEGNYPPSINDIELFCKETITKRFWYYPPVGRGIVSQRFLGIYVTEQSRSEPILDISDGISNKDLFQEMRELLIERVKEIYGDLGSNERKRVWEPAPFTIEQRAFEYAIQEGMTREEWNALNLADMEQTAAYQKALTDAIYTTNRCKEYFNKTGRFMLEKTMHHGIQSIYFSFNAKLIDRRKSTMLSRAKGGDATIDSEQELVEFMSSKQYKDVTAMGSDSFRSLWWVPSTTGQNVKMGCIDIDNPAGISERRLKTVVKGFATKLENNEIPYIIMFTGKTWQIWFGTAELGEFVSLQEVNRFIERELVKGSDVVFGHGEKYIQEAIIKDVAHVDSSVNNKNKPLGMFFGMHYKPQRNPEDSPGTGLVRVPVPLNQLSTFDPIVDAHPENVLKNFSSLSLQVDNWFNEVEIGIGHESKGAIESKPLCGRSEGLEPDFETSKIAEKWKKGSKFIEYDFETARTDIAEEPELIVTPKLDGWLGVLHYKAAGGFKLNNKRLSIETTRRNRQGVTKVAEEVQTVLVTSSGIVMWDNHITREFERTCKQLKVREAIITGELIAYDDFGKVAGPHAVTTVINRKEREDESQIHQNAKLFSKLRFASHDLIKLDSKEFVPETDFREKHQLMKEFDGFRIFAVEYYVLTTPFSQRLDTLWEQITVTDGHEGMVVYANKKRIKVKRKFTVDAVIIGIDKNSKRWQDGKGIGSAYVAVMKKRPKYGITYINIGKVGTTGITDAERANLTELVLGEDNANIVPIQKTFERLGEEVPAGLENIIFVEPTTVVEVHYETLMPDRLASWSVYRKQNKGRGRSARASLMYVDKPVFARRMRSPRIVAVREDKNALNYLDANYEQGEMAGGFKIGARPNPTKPDDYHLPLPQLEKLEQWVLAPVTAEKQQRVVRMEIDQLVTRSFVGKVHSQDKFKGPIDMWRKLYRLMDRGREFIGFVKDNEIHYGSSHIRGSVIPEIHDDVLGCDFAFHTHPYSRLFRTEFGMMSPADLNTMAWWSLAFDIKWHVIVEQYGFECIKITPTKKMLKLWGDIEKYYGKNKAKYTKAVKTWETAIRKHYKICNAAYTNKTSARNNFFREAIRNQYAFTPFDCSAATVEEINNKSEYFQYEYYTLPLPLYTLDFKGTQPQIEAIKNPAFYGYEPQRMIRGGTDSEDRFVKIEDEFKLAHERAYSLDPPPGDQKMYLFGAQKQGYSAGHQPANIRGQRVYLDATNLGLNFATAIYDEFGEGQDAAKILPKYDKDYTVPKSWYDIERGLYHNDKDQNLRDFALGIRVVWDMARPEGSLPTDELEATKFFNKWHDALDSWDEEYENSGKVSKLPKEEKRKLVKVLEHDIANNPALNCGCGQSPCITYGTINNPQFVTPEWEDRVDVYIDYRATLERDNIDRPLFDLDKQMRTKYPAWEYSALEKARRLREAEIELGYTEDEISMIKQSFSPQTSSVSLSSAFSSLFGPSLHGELEEEEEDDDGTIATDD